MRLQVYSLSLHTHCSETPCVLGEGNNRHYVGPGVLLELGNQVQSTKTLSAMKGEGQEEEEDGGKGGGGSLS